jgi:hypothetical protein
MVCVHILETVTTFLLFLQSKVGKGLVLRIQICVETFLIRIIGTRMFALIYFLDLSNLFYSFQTDPVVLPVDETRKPVPVFKDPVHPAEHQHAPLLPDPLLSHQGVQQVHNCPFQLYMRPLGSYSGKSRSSFQFCRRSKKLVFKLIFLILRSLLGRHLLRIIMGSPPNAHSLTLFFRKTFLL